MKQYLIHHIYVFHPSRYRVRRLVIFIFFLHSSVLCLNEHKLGKWQKTLIMTLQLLHFQFALLQIYINSPINLIINVKQKQEQLTYTLRQNKQKLNAKTGMF